jgi:hypothetical protein
VKKSSAHRVLTKAELLPLPTSEALRISLKHHLALTALSHGTVEERALATVCNAIYLAFFLRDPLDTDITVYGQAEAAVNAIVARIDAGDKPQMTSDEHDAVAQCLIQLDMFLAQLPAHRIFSAWAQVKRTTLSGHRSPIPRHQ